MKEERSRSDDKDKKKEGMMMSLKPIHEQVVVLMGASSGIGRLAALEFAHRGAKVVVSARSGAGLRTLVDQIRRDGGEAISVTADTSQFEQVKAVAEAAVSAYGRIDTWVHLAAVAVYAPFEETTPEEFQQVINVNLMGQVYGAQVALPYLRREGRGALIHISSIEAIRSMPYHSAYAASKHGLKGFLEALRLELNHEGIPISVTNIMPASINTPFFDKARTKLGVKPKGIPPIYEPEVVVSMILYAAEHPSRDLFAGDAAKIMSASQTLAPSLTDKFLSWTAFKGQKTSEPKSEADPNNLFQPIPGFDRVHGDFSGQAMAVSPYTQMQKTNTGLMVGIAGLVIGAVLAMRSRSSSNGVRHRENISRSSPSFYQPEGGF
jgi:NAD(P)-dependent dehydrogenase (short-subunit alcohol dehydrogenase family)